MKKNFTPIVLTDVINKDDFGKVCIYSACFYGIYQIGKLFIENNYDELKLNIGKFVKLECNRKHCYKELPIIDVEPVKPIS